MEGDRQRKKYKIPFRGVNVTEKQIVNCSILAKTRREIIFKNKRLKMEEEWRRDRTEREVEEERNKLRELIKECKSMIEDVSMSNNLSPVKGSQSANKMQERQKYKKEVIEALRQIRKMLCTDRLEAYQYAIDLGILEMLTTLMRSQLQVEDKENLNIRNNSKGVKFLLDEGLLYECIWCTNNLTVASKSNQPKFIPLFKLISSLICTEFSANTYVSYAIKADAMKALSNGIQDSTGIFNHLSPEMGDILNSTVNLMFSKLGHLRRNGMWLISNIIMNDINSTTSLLNLGLIKIIINILDGKDEMAIIDSLWVCEKLTCTEGNIKESDMQKLVEKLLSLLSPLPIAGIARPLLRTIGNILSSEGHSLISKEIICNPMYLTTVEIILDNKELQKEGLWLLSTLLLYPNPPPWDPTAILHKLATLITPHTQFTVKREIAFAFYTLAQIREELISDILEYTLDMFLSFIQDLSVPDPELVHLALSFIHLAIHNLGGPFLRVCLHKDIPAIVERAIFTSYKENEDIYSLGDKILELIAHVQPVDAQYGY